MLFKFSYVSVLIICTVSIKWCSCQRRILNGKISESGKRFMVYLLNSKYSSKQPVGWLCGGALISESHILTSAACLTEVQFMYAIAGYRKYVSGENINKDKCTKEKKQRIVSSIVPAGYKKGPSPEEWVKYDVGIAIVEKPYNFTDISYYVICSYAPTKTFINYDKRFEIPSTTGYIYGWGAEKGRKTNDNIDNNVEYMHQAKTVITNTSFCAHYVNEKLKPIVEGSLLCAYGSGYRTQAGLEAFDPTDDCWFRRFSLNEDCKEVLEAGTEKINDRNSMEMPARRSYDEASDAGGICENDRGGPMVTYYGSSEVIIGISITNVYISRFQCEGPYLYFGLAKMGPLIKCLLAKTSETIDLCKQLSYEAKKVFIKWPEASKLDIISSRSTRKTTTQPTTRTTHFWKPKRTPSSKRPRVRYATKFGLRQGHGQQKINMRVTVIDKPKIIHPDGVNIRPTLT